MLRKKRNFGAFGAMTDDLKKAIEELDCRATSSEKFTTSNWIPGTKYEFLSNQIMWKMNSERLVNDAYAPKPIITARVGTGNEAKICSWNVYKFLNNPKPADRIATELKPYITKPAAQVTLQDIVNAEHAWAIDKRKTLIKQMALTLGTDAINAYEKAYLEALKNKESEEIAKQKADAQANLTLQENKEETYVTSIDESGTGGDESTDQSNTLLVIGTVIASAGLGAFIISRFLK